MRLPFTNFLLVSLVLTMILLSPMSVVVCGRIAQPETWALVDDWSCADQTASAARVALAAIQFLMAALALPTLARPATAVSQRTYFRPGVKSLPDFAPALQTPPPRLK